MGTRFNLKPTPPLWRPLLDQWVMFLQAKGLRPATVRVRRQHVVHFARAHSDLAPHDVTVQDVLTWTATKSWKPETRHGVHASWSSFLSWLHGHTITMPTIRRPRAVARPAPDHILNDILACDDDRVALAARLAAWAGLRRCEIVLVALEDLIDDLTGKSLIVHGKGGIQRLVPLSTALEQAITSYAARHAISSGWLFPGADQGHISATWLGKLVNAKLSRPWSLHCLRHSFATSAFRASRDIVVVQQLLGHASIATTQRYLAIPDEALRDAVNQIAA